MIFFLLQYLWILKYFKYVSTCCFGFVFRFSHYFEMVSDSNLNPVDEIGDGMSDIFLKPERMTGVPDYLNVCQIFRISARHF